MLQRKFENNSVYQVYFQPHRWSEYEDETTDPKTKLLV